MFRRRRSADAGQDWSNESEDTDRRSGGQLDDEPSDDESADRTPQAAGGPWDAEESYPVQERVDLGAVKHQLGAQGRGQLGGKRGLADADRAFEHHKTLR